MIRYPLNPQLDAVYDQGFEAGQHHASRITLGESSYGATQSALVAVEFTSFQALREEIRARRDHIRGDRPGMAYLWTCEVIHIHHNDYNKVAILKFAKHWDIWTLNHRSIWTCVLT